MTNCFILLAAGKGKRFKSKLPKQYINFKNKLFNGNEKFPTNIKKIQNYILEKV